MPVTPTELIHLQLSSLHTLFCFLSSSGLCMSTRIRWIRYRIIWSMQCISDSTWKTLTSQTCTTSNLFSLVWVYWNSFRPFHTSVCACTCIAWSSFHLQITSVEMDADQLVPYVCQGLGLLHNEQQDTLASVCCFTLSNNNREPKFLSVFQSSYLHSALSACTWWYDLKGGVMMHILILLHSFSSWDW